MVFEPAAYSSRRRRVEAPRSYRSAAAGIARREVGLARTLPKPRRLSGYSILGRSWHAPAELIHKPWITQTEVADRNRCARLPVKGGASARSSRSLRLGTTASLAADRRSSGAANRKACRRRESPTGDAWRKPGCWRAETCCVANDSER